MGSLSDIRFMSRKTVTSTAAKSGVIFDIDGTLADTAFIMEKLGYHFEPSKKNLDVFHRLSVKAEPHSWVVDMVHENMAIGHDIIVVTARNEAYKNYTVRWLDKHGIPYDALYMRGRNDVRPDAEVKKDILKQLESKWRIVHAYDDNPSVIELWRSHNISTTVVPGWPELETAR